MEDKAPSFRPLTCHSCEQGTAPLAFLDGETGRVVCNHHYFAETCAKAKTDIPEEKKKESVIVVDVVKEIEKAETSSDDSVLSDKSSPGSRRGPRLDQKEGDSDLPLGFSVSYEDLTSLGLEDNNNNSKRNMSVLPDFDLEDLNDEELKASLRVEDVGNRIMDATVTKFLESNNMDIEKPESLPQGKTLLDQNIQMTLFTLDSVVEQLITTPDAMKMSDTTVLSKDGALRRALWSEFRYSPNLRSGERVWSTWFSAQLHKINVVADSDVEYYSMMQDAIFKYINSGQARRFSYSLKPSKGEVILLEYIREGEYMCSRARVEAVFVSDGPEEVKVNVTFVDIGGRQERVDCNYCFFMPDAIAKLPIWGLTVEFSGVQPGGISEDTLSKVPVYIDGSDRNCKFLDIFRKVTLTLKLENEVTSDMYHIFYRGILTFGNSKVSVNNLVSNIIRDICTEEKRQIKVREILKKRSATK